jgi:hypothetical protein
MLQPMPGVEHATGSVPSPNGQLLHAHQRSVPLPTQLQLFVSPLFCGIVQCSSPGGHGEFIAHELAFEPLLMSLPLPSLSLPSSPASSCRHPLTSTINRRRLRMATPSATVAPRVCAAFHEVAAYTV